MTLKQGTMSEFDFAWIKQVAFRYATSAEDTGPALAQCVAEIERLTKALAAADSQLLAHEEEYRRLTSGLSKACDGWIPLTDAARPTDGEHVFVAGYGFKGRFYAEAVYEHGEWLMFDQEVDRYCHPCEYPTFWSRINPIPQKATKP
jgi:hypothetical protein